MFCAVPPKVFYPNFWRHCIVSIGSTNNRNQTKKAAELSTALVGLPGFEPRMTGPESVVLPLHHSPIFVFDDAKVELIF